MYLYATKLELSELLAASSKNLETAWVLLNYNSTSNLEIVSWNCNLIRPHYWPQFRYSLTNFGEIIGENVKINAAMANWNITLQIKSLYKWGWMRLTGVELVLKKTSFWLSTSYSFSFLLNILINIINITITFIKPAIQVELQTNFK